MKRSAPEVEYEKAEDKVPRSFVFKMGKVGKSVKELVEDLRLVMQPNTATRLQTRSHNTMKDFLSVAGPLGISHFIVVSQTEKTLSLRIAKTPKGPTLQFKVSSFSTAHDVQGLHVKPLNMPASELDTSPLVVLNNMQAAGADQRHLQLMSASFQNMFAPINVHTVKLKQCNRVVLFDRNPETNVISVRHFRIVLNPVGISKSVKRVAQKRKLKLSEYKDVSEYVLSQVKASESDAEDDSEAQVAVEEEVRGMLGGRSAKDKEKNKQPRQAAIRLIEIGPRVEMTLAKIYAGFMEGEIMWHWKGLDLARLNQQRKHIAQLGDKKVGEFPGAQQVLKRERDEAEAEREEAQQEQEAEQRDAEERKAKRAARKPAVGFKKKTKK